MGSYIENGYRKIERKYSNFFKSTKTRLEQYIVISKRSEKFAPIELEVLTSRELPDPIRDEVEDLYRPIMS